MTDIRYTATAPFRLCPLTYKIFGQAHDPEKGEVDVLDVRGWGYLTGGGHGAIGLPYEQAGEIQERTALRTVHLLNTYLEDDGRPMTTDAFVNKLLTARQQSSDFDHYDALDALKHWNEGAWDEALEMLEAEDAD